MAKQSERSRRGGARRGRRVPGGGGVSWKKSPADVDGAARHLRAAQRLCPPGRPAAMAKIERLMESVEMKQSARHDT